MNIFVLDTNPVVAAQMQCNRHVVKMCLETAQLLSTACGGPYKPTHINHPCSVWTRSNRVNYNWLVMHGLALCEEYGERYGKVHKCEAIISSLANRANDFPIGFTDFVQCMPDQYKDKNAVIAYRTYYHSKADFAVWPEDKVPYWWQPELISV